MIINKTCNKCGKQYDPDNPDPCLGTLPSVCCACCGHGKGAPYFLIWCDEGQTIANTSAFRLVVRGTGEEIKIIHEVSVGKDNSYVDDIEVKVPCLEFNNYVNLLSKNKNESIKRILLKCNFYKAKVEFKRTIYHSKIKSTLPLRELSNIFEGK